MSFRLTALSFALLSSTAVLAANPHDDQVGRALGHIKKNAAAFAASADDQFAVRDVIVDGNGDEHVRFERSHKGLRVIGGDVVAHGNGKGQFKSASKSLKGAMNIRTNPVIDEAQAVLSAEAAFRGQRNGQSSSELVVHARGDAVLAWDVKVTGERADGTPSEWHAIIDANTGALIDSWDDIHVAAAAGTGKGFFSGNVAMTFDLVSGTYSLRDPSRGNMYTTDLKNRTNGSGTVISSTSSTIGTGSLSDRATTGIDAQYGTAVTWDYFKNVHGRNGIANDGKGAYNRVHYGRNYVNAFWSDSCFCMTYGDGDGTNYYPLDSLDVAGHEMAHGVTSRTAKLVYSGESGGLNEATSDIFGTLVEFYAANANDPGDYKIGEELYIKYPDGSKAMRYMYNPILDTKSPSCYASTLGSLDVHYSSGVANRFFYFLSEGNTALSGATCNGASLSGIGKDKAGKIWYRALTVYMTSNTNYAGARVATVNAATDLYGASSAEVAAVKAAWSAVSVN